MNDLPWLLLVRKEYDFSFVMSNMEASLGALELLPLATGCPALVGKAASKVRLAC